MARHLDLLFARTLPPSAPAKRETFRAAASLAAGLTFVSALLLVERNPRLTQVVPALVSLEVAAPLTKHVDLPPDEPAQNYALIPSGVASARELRVALANDSALQWHFADFDVDQAVLRVLVRDERAYVSYRKDGQILWTKHSLLLHKGEFVLDDGAHKVRARCGNRIAEIPTESVPLVTQLERPTFFPGPPPEIPFTPEVPPPTKVYLPPPPTCCNFPIVPIIYVPPGGGGPTIPPSPPLRVAEPPTIAVFGAVAFVGFILGKKLLRRDRAGT